MIAFEVVSLGGLAFAEGPPLRQAFVTTEKAFIWDRPGFSYKDCRGLDSKSHYSSEDDKNLSLTRFSSGGRSACENRMLLLDAGDEIMVVPTKEGYPKSETKKVIIGGELVDKKFYQVQAIPKKDAGKKNGVIKGWISEDQISKVSQEQILTQMGHEKEQESPEEPACDPPFSVKKTQKTAAELLKVTDKELKLPPRKSDQEIDYFMCLHRDDSIGFAQFTSRLAQFKKTAKDAEKDFKVPYGLTMCTILDESGLRFNANENDEYIGYGQFGSALVEDLSRKINQPGYHAMWTAYSQKNPTAKFTDVAIRRSDNPAAAVGAVALAMNWLYTERIAAAGCKDCTHADSLDKMNKKDLYMLVAGYNFSPYNLNRLGKRSPSSLKKHYPPPQETRNYMTQMENCLSKGQQSEFRKKAPAASAARIKECHSYSHSQR